MLRPAEAGHYVLWFVTQGETAKIAVSMSTEPTARNPRPAATVLVLRDSAEGPEIFMVRRGHGAAFMGGAYVFPGGRVDQGDAGSADESWCTGIAGASSSLAGVAAPDAVGYYVAAARELFEEAGVLVARDPAGRFVSLADAGAHARFKQYRTDVHAGSRTLRALVEGEGLRLALDTLVPFAHWVTPPIDIRQFDTRFFVTRVPPDQSPAHDDAETVESTWIAPADAIARCRRGEIVLPPPTWTSLRELERFASVEDAIAWARSRRIARREPRFVDEDGRKMLLLPGDPLGPDPAGDDIPFETRFVLSEGRWRAERPTA